MLILRHRSAAAFLHSQDPKLTRIANVPWISLASGSLPGDCLDDSYYQKQQLVLIWRNMLFPKIIY
jgi:hypothetical protein